MSLIVCLFTSLALCQEGMEIPLSARYQAIGRVAPQSLAWTVNFAETRGDRTVIQFASTQQDLGWKLVTTSDVVLTPANIQAAGGSVMVVKGGAHGVLGVQTGQKLTNVVITAPGFKYKSFTIEARPGQLQSEAPIFFNIDFIGGAFSLGLIANDGEVSLNQPLAVTAAAFYQNQPVQDAFISALLVSPTGVTTLKTMFDNGADADQQAGDGLYTASFTPNESGSWTLGVMGKFAADNLTVLRTNSATFDVTVCNIRFVPGAPVTAQCVFTPQTSLLSEVTVRAAVQVAELGDYVFTATARVGDSSETVETSQSLRLTPGVHQIEIPIPAYALRASGSDGPIVIEEVAAYCTYPNTSRGDRLVLQNVAACTISILDFPGPDVQFLAPCLSRLEDTNANDLADRLIVTLPLAVRTAGFYQYNASLCDSCGRIIEDIHGWVSIPRSARYELDLVFNGSRIGLNGVDGPYRLCQFVLWRGESVFMQWGVNCLTEAYAVNRFEDWQICPDRNQNNQCDTCDIQNGGQGVDQNADGIPDDSPHQQPCVAIADIVGPGGPPAAPNGCVNSDDLTAFLTAYDNGSLLADVSGPDGVPDGVVNQLDFDAFMLAYAQCFNNCGSIGD